MTDYPAKEALECINTTEAGIRRILKRLKAKAHDHESASLRHLIERV